MLQMNKVQSGNMPSMQELMQNPNIANLYVFISSRMIHFMNPCFQSCEVSRGWWLDYMSESVFIHII